MTWIDEEGKLPKKIECLTVSGASDEMTLSMIDDDEYWLENKKGKGVRLDSETLFEILHDIYLESI